MRSPSFRVSLDLDDYAIPAALNERFCGLCGSVNPNPFPQRGRIKDDPEPILPQRLGRSTLILSPQWGRTKDDPEPILPQGLGWSAQTHFNSGDVVRMALNPSCHKIWISRPKPIPTVWIMNPSCYKVWVGLPKSLPIVSANWVWPWTHPATKFGSINPNPSSQCGRTEYDLESVLPQCLDRSTQMHCPHYCHSVLTVCPLDNPILTFFNDIVVI